MKKFLLAATAIAALASGTAAMAEDGISYNISATSDYKFRGISQTKNNIAVQGGVDYNKGKFYAGVWGSNVDFGDTTDVEVDVYAGYKPTVGIVNLDFAAILYTYANQPKGSHLSLAEVKAAATAPLGKGTIGAAVYASIDNYDASGKKETRFADSLYGEVNVSYPITESLGFSAAFGNTKLAAGSFATPTKKIINTDEYATMNVGLTYALTPNLSADVRYWDTNRRDFGDAFKPKTVITVKAAF